jgi:hypothetical protein
MFVDRMKVASLGRAPALLANIRLAGTGLPGTNTLAYYEHLQITAVKSFITADSGYVQRRSRGRLLPTAGHLPEASAGYAGPVFRQD